jgi:uncharacterized DUF497 family protein
MKFQWDEKKDRKNQRKHKITFAEAATVFADPMLLVVPDTTTDTDEETYLAVGRMLNSYTVLLVAHTYRDENDEEVTRIISARTLSKGEVRNHGYGH